jgi:hypothetical protein
MGGVLAGRLVHGHLLLFGCLNITCGKLMVVLGCVDVSCIACGSGKRHVLCG